MNAEHTLDSFAAHEGSTIALYLDERNVVDLELVRVEDLSNEKLESFSVMLKSTPDVLVSDHIYRVQHRELGDFEMFIANVNQSDRDGNYYEAIFSQLKT